MWETLFDVSMLGRYKEIGIKCSSLEAVKELAVIVAQHLDRIEFEVVRDFTKWYEHYDDTILYVTFDGLLMYSDQSWAERAFKAGKGNIFWCSFEGECAKCEIVEVEDLL